MSYSVQHSSHATVIDGGPQYTPINDQPIRRTTIGIDDSKLVKAGYRMTLLRAAFTISTAAGWKTGLENRKLVGKDTKEVDRQLYGKKRGWWRRREDFAQVDIDIFGDIMRAGEINEGQELRRRDRGIMTREEVVLKEHSSDVSQPAGMTGISRTRQNVHEVQHI